MRVEDLVKKTPAYKSALADKKAGSVSHAYLIVSPDKDYLDKFLKIFTKLFACDSDEGFCDSCRTCRLIDSETLLDVKFIPEGKDKIAVEDVAFISNDVYIKPYEGKKKIYVLRCADTMNLNAQNKLLKTLEEPPENVMLILGAKSEDLIIKTVLSRVKKLYLPLFSEEDIYSVLSETCPDKDKLKKAVYSGDGTLSRSLSLYNDEKLDSIIALAKDVIINMNTPQDVLRYSVKVNELGDGIEEFFDMLTIAFHSMLNAYENGKESPLFKGLLEKSAGYTEGAVIYAIQAVTAAIKNKISNVNLTMVIDSVLFSVLEGKYKWRKL